MSGKLYFLFFALVSLVASQQWKIDASLATPWSHYWETCVGSGHAALSLRQDWQSALTQAHNDLGFQYVRFHGLLDDDMSVVLPNPSGSGVVYSFYNIDTSFDFLLSIGMKPLVEVSFMPDLLSSGNSTVFHYKGNTCPPASYSAWQDLLTNLTTHLISRYGATEVRSWFFEIWNEPNCGFWSATQEQYFTFLNYSFNAIKSVDSGLQVGGPATCQSQWIDETLAYCQQNGFQLDFISTHEYPTDVQPVQRGIMQKVINETKQKVGSLPLFYTEYNDGLYFNPSYHDTPYASAFIMKNIPDIQGLVDVLSWWTFTDIFEEGGQESIPFFKGDGWGLLNYYQVPKPSYRAFQLLHGSGNESLLVTPGREIGTAGVYAIRDAGKREIKIFAYNHNIPGAPIQNQTIEISLVNAPSIYRADIRRIDDNNANAPALWLQMGSPQYLTKPQVSALIAASIPIPQTQKFTQKGNTVSFTPFVLSPEGVAEISVHY